MTAIKRAKMVGFALAGLILAAACGEKRRAEATAAERPSIAPPAAAGDPAITAEDFARHVARLASDEFEGRGPVSPGGEKTRAYIAGEFARLGLEPVGPSFDVPVPLVESNIDPAASRFSVATPAGARALAYKTDIVYWTKRVTPEVEIADSDVVFVGYGIVAPEYQWNDYAGVDARGKTVVMLINDPGYATEDPALFNGKAMTYYGRWTYKFEEAARQGAAAAIIIHDTGPAAYGWNVVETSWAGPQIDLKREDDGASRVAVEAWLANAAARDLFAASGVDFDALTAAAKTRGFTATPLPGAKASARLVSAIRRSEDANVVGVLKGATAPDEYVLYTAHWDHLGIDPAVEGEDKIFNGAVDNATGVAAILEIAEKFAAGPRPRRSVVFAAVTAEESGLLGSAYLAENPPIALKNVAGGFNIDGMLPTPPARDVIVIGYGASELEDLLKVETDRRGLYIRPDAEPAKGYFYRSDHISFAKKGVPMLYADSGLDLAEGGEAAGKALADDYTARRYHQVTDQYDPSWPLESSVQITDILYAVGAGLADSDAWPNWRPGNEFRALRDAQRASE